MSGISGLVRLDGAPAQIEQLAPVHRALAFRGPDGEGMWSGGPAALGFRLLATTPQARAEQQPWRHEDSGCVIVADARLDNREELAAALGMDLGARGDGELILRAYLRWGEDAPSHLLGDFAFAVWDDRRRRLFAARDPVGMRQFHYAHRPGRLLAFATDDHVLLRHADVPKRLDETRVADLLEGLEGADLEATFYRDIRRLPPAHRLLLEEGRLSLSRYWKVEPREPLRLGTDAAYAEAFLSVFQEAVSARLQSPLPAGAMLSGGLDSSSICAVAARLLGGDRLPTFSAVSRDETDCVETHMIRMVQRSGRIRPFEVTPDRITTPSDHSYLGHRNPFDGYMWLPLDVYAAAERHGCNVLLDGGAADVVLGHRALVPRYLRKGRLLRAWRESRGGAAFWQTGGSSTTRLLGDVRVALIPDWARHLKNQALRYKDRILPLSPVLRPEFAVRIGIADRRQALRKAVPPPGLPYPVDRARAILHPHEIAATERYDRVASACGIEARAPFSDLRLLDFVLALPGEQLLRDGWTKYILRVAMAGLLPDEVRWRRGKPHLGGQFVAAAALAEEEERCASLQASRALLTTWVRPELLAFLDPAGIDNGPGDRIMHLALWLSKQGFVDQPA